MTFKASYRDHYKLTQTVLWITHTLLILSFNISNITVSFTLTYSWSILFKTINVVKQILFPRLFFPCHVYWQYKLWGFEIKVPYEVCVCVYTHTHGVEKLHEVIGGTTTNIYCQITICRTCILVVPRTIKVGLTMVRNQAKPLKYSEETL
jgi:hypothetical protein